MKPVTSIVLAGLIINRVRKRYLVQNLCYIVKENTIKALIDDNIIIDFAKENKILSIRPEVELSKPFGIASWYTTAALRNIRLEKIENM